MLDAIGQLLEVGDTVVVSPSRACSDPYLAKVVGFGKNHVLIHIVQGEKEGSTPWKRAPHYLIAYKTLKGKGH